ncbi:hypothetical protein OUZ56_005610 [Daphnia magna]|uniref:Uncharacterized protein n=1 Tax=Daphnia magna TaxID=35525 RepID=A0ABQ9YT96_9CRUS|nr:hypothetical protein OUZ56_005610 [Daphnia magna]
MVRGIENPADKGSRGLFPDEMMENYRWFNGADFLQQEENAWPITNKLPEPSVEGSEPLKVEESGYKIGQAECPLIPMGNRKENYAIPTLFRKIASTMSSTICWMKKTRDRQAASLLLDQHNEENPQRMQ